MSSAIFDAGDKNRFDREAQLTEQAPRILQRDDAPPAEPKDDVKPLLLKGIFEVLKAMIK